MLLLQVTGDWVLVWSTSENATEHENWNNIISSHVELRLHGNVLTFDEKNMER